MNHKRCIFFSLSTLTLLCLTAPSSAQLHPALTNPAPANDQPLDHGRRLLEAVHDNVPSFDDPAFYWFCNYVRDHADSHDTLISTSDVPISFRALMERPGDFRGRIVQIEGIVQSRNAYDLANRAALGTLVQCELSDASSDFLCTIISPLENENIKIGDRVRAKGYFIKIRSYQTRHDDPEAGPVLVVGSIVPVTTPNNLASTQKAKDWTGVLTGTTAALAILWFVIRRGTSRRLQSSTSAFRRTGTSKTSDADFDWLTAKQNVKNAASACNHIEQCDNTGHRA